MKKIKNICIIALTLFVAFAFCSCKNSGNNNQNGDKSVAEKVSLVNTVLNEVEFENSNGTKLKQEGNIVTITGTIDALSDSQKSEFGEQNTTHCVMIKFMFDKERTISKFKIKGEKTKVYSDSKDVDNYYGKLSDLLDSRSGEDAYTKIILSANTSEYDLVSTYTDGTESTIKIKIVATLATATNE